MEQHEIHLSRLARRWHDGTTSAAAKRCRSVRRWPPTGSGGADGVGSPENSSQKTCDVRSGRTATVLSCEHGSFGSGGRRRWRGPCGAGRRAGTSVGTPARGSWRRRCRCGRAQISALLRAQLADIAEFDRAEAWRGDGAGSMTVWVTEQCGVSASTARQWVRAATDLAELPVLSESLASGEMSLDKVAPLAEVASPETEADIRSAAATGRSSRLGISPSGTRRRRRRWPARRAGVRAPDPALQRCPADDVGGFHT